MHILILEHRSSLLWQMRHFASQVVGKDNVIGVSTTDEAEQHLQTSTPDVLISVTDFIEDDHLMLGFIANIKEKLPKLTVIGVAPRISDFHREHWTMPKVNATLIGRLDDIPYLNKLVEVIEKLVTSDSDE